MGVAAALLSAPAAGAAPQWIDGTAWAKWGDLSSLRVVPSAAARVAAAEVGTVPQSDAAWAEVVAREPYADTAGMRAQFMCHWRFAEFVAPGKPSWNLEPWRPDVDDETMAAAGCNPGGTEEPF